MRPRAEFKGRGLGTPGINGRLRRLYEICAQGTHNRSILMSLGALSLACFSILSLAGCESQAAPSFQRPPAPVSVVDAVSRDVPVYLDEIGKVVPREVVSVQPQVSGRITEIHFVDGADVKSGDLLFTIDPRPYKAQLDAAEAKLAQMKAALELAKIQYQRVASIADTKAVSKQEYDTRKNAVDVADAQVRQSKAEAETARLNLEYCYVRSPIDGRVGQRLIDLGNVVAANTGSLLVIERLDPIYADFTVTENDLTAVQRNMTRGTLGVEVRLPDEPEKPRAGKLTFLDNLVQDGTGTVKLRATIPNADRCFWPGRFVKVRLVLSTLEGAVLVPAAASMMSAKGSFVYILKDDSTAELRPVQLGQRQEDMVVVAQGVKGGERVIVKGQIGVTPGGMVRVEDPRGSNNSQAANAGGRS